MFALSALWIRCASASGESEEAEIDFQLGLVAYADGNLERALADFLASNRLAPNPAVAFNIARCYAKTEQYAEAYRWYTVAREGIDDPDTLKSVANGIAAIKPKVVVYELTSDPPGATVYVESKDLGAAGVTPFALGLAKSDHRTLIFEAEGYRDVVMNDVKGDEGGTVPLAAKLERIVGTVAIDADQGAEVHLGAPDGPLLCAAPCEAPVAPGNRVLYVRRPGYHDAVVQLEVVADQRIYTKVALQPDTGTLVVDASERGALVEIDGQAAGFTPVVLPAVPVGTRVVRVSRPGYRAVEETVEVQNERSVDLGTLELLPLDAVTAVSRREEDVSLAPSSVSVITRDEIEAFAYPTIFEALRGVRGFALTYDSVYGSTAIRGLGQANDFGNRLLVLSDGAILNDNLLYQSYLGYEARSDLGGISQIEVVRGPGSLLYGAGAVSGVVNLVGETNEGPNGVEVEGGTYDRALHGGIRGHYANGNFGIRANFAGAGSQGREELVDPRGVAPELEVDGFDAFEGANTTGRMWIGHGTVQWYHAWRTIHIPTGAYATNLGDGDRHYWVDQRSLVEARFEPELSPRATLLTRYYGNRYAFDGYYPYGLSSSHERYLGLSGGAEVRVIGEPTDWLRAQLGAQGDVSPIASMNGENLDATGAFVDAYLNEAHPYQIGGGYALLDLDAGSHLHLSGGSRIDYWSTFGVAVSPRASIVASITDADVVKLMAGRAFRAPSIFELYYNLPGFQLAPVNLQPEQVWSGELEYSHAFDARWTGLVSGYGSVVQGLVSTIPAPGNPGAVTYGNSAEDVRIVGADAEVRRSFQRGTMVNAWVSLLDSRDAAGDPVPNQPGTSGAVKVVLPVVNPFARVAARTTLEGARRIDASRVDYTGVAVIADLVVSGSAPSAGIDYAIGVYNVANTRYNEPLTDTFPFRTMPQPGRSLLATVTKDLR